MIPAQIHARVRHAATSRSSILPLAEFLQDAVEPAADFLQRIFNPVADFLQPMVELVAHFLQPAVNLAVPGRGKDAGQDDRRAYANDGDGVHGESIRASYKGSGPLIKEGNTVGFGIFQPRTQATASRRLCFR